MSEPSHSIDLDEALSHAPFLRRIARALVRDDQTVDDLLQETFVAAIEHPPARTGRLRSWLAAVLKSKAQVDLHNTNLPDGSYTLHAFTDTGLEARAERRYAGRSAKRDIWIVDLR